MEDLIKIATWNVCLGLKPKKDYISTKIKEESINICCIQECEIEPDYPENLLTFRDYRIEIETNTMKSRCCIYLNNSISYTRRKELEGINNHIIVVDLDLKEKYRLINIYRTFAPQGGVSPSDKFDVQINLISSAVVDSPNRIPLIVGDFNLDYNKIFNSEYQHKLLYQKLTNTFENLNLIQLVEFNTWSRLINGILKTSTLDHVYTNDHTIINHLSSFKPEIGDHNCVIFSINDTMMIPPPILKRDWRRYSKNLLEQKLSQCKFETGIDSVQELWNSFENEIINIVDELVPLVPFTNNYVASSSTPKYLTSKINKRRRLLKRFRQTHCNILKRNINVLNYEIKSDILSIKKKNVRRAIVPGNSKSLWSAVKIAKDVNSPTFPNKMFHNNTEITRADLPDAFAIHFRDKVALIVSENKVDDNVYNGKQKIKDNCMNFMTPNNVIDAIKTIKIKNCEGYDRIPQRILVDGIKYLAPPLIELFNMIYHKCEIPEQWLVSKIIPVHKKGNSTHIDNYRPIANLCSATKNFEKLILMRLTQLEIKNKCDLTGKEQHGFKPKRSTATAGLVIQSIISHALDQNNYALMASLDLSAAFDVVNIDLLLTRLETVGLPMDVIKLIKLWLENRYFYVTVNGDNSYMMLSDTGTVQGSILGPILYAIFVSPLFDLIRMTNYADDNYVIRCNKCIAALINDMQKSLEAITKWLKKSGLKVNESKTEMCLFHRNDVAPIQITVNNSIIKSKPSMNVLGVIFDCKLQWHEQAAATIKKSKRALYCTKLIKNYFTPHELALLITSNFYSILYYNSEIWNISTLNSKLKQDLLSASASALKICTPSYHMMMSFYELHNINNRATPTQMSHYKLALTMFTLFNKQEPTLDWVDLNFQQIFNQRNTTLNFVNSSNYKVGQNILCNRLTCLNNKIEQNWLNISKESFKIKCKNLFFPKSIVIPELVE